ncbi:MAG TPA: nucleotidyltransferase domain-containing protein [Thermodesulfobacteriota bacterium]|nr:nucleotidyltransferase domain-containing protein [Deltaproteobacteria bacterium]HNR12217.1 nucleotidyltransferase domain-containing protein [Thermodesulfobacteriota bacterium]HNU70363.1 nucleotidyltransferase domain-containing protein [Thermodesulfobacteriota bacterium]HOC38111.1 nucleotidyltransferase domain-containing protein [Thermodesulfobacteriota bacterium]HQO77598.1 nucleotidyltransferase domain-containing protein [Thermodesulfobacteriota bacterium]
MNATEEIVLERFKALLLGKLHVVHLILFGSRARGDAAPDSDMDIVVVLDQRTSEAEEYVSDCAWEAGVDDGIVVCPIVYSVAEWEQSPLRYSSFVRTVQQEGIYI